MKRYAKILLFLSCLCTVHAVLAGSVWQRVYSHQLSGYAKSAYTSGYTLFRADEESLKAQVNAARDGVAAVVALPLPDGSLREFRISRSFLVPDKLARRYAGLATYNGVAVDNPNVTAKLDFTLYGFHAMIFDKEVSFIDPAADDHSGYYTVHYKSEETLSSERNLRCLVEGDNSFAPAINGTLPYRKLTAGTYKRVSNGYDLRTYRLALACDHQYARAVTGLDAPSVAEVLSKMVTTMNRVNGIYEREIAVTMVFVENEDRLIFPTETGDPFGSQNDAPGPLLELNQRLCDSLIGNGNYDVGHIFSTGAGGLSQLGVVCDDSMKAQSVTGSSVPKGDGYDIDYVAHEMGHEFGSQHTFNNNGSDFCLNNAVADCAFEPGSGSTIMCYAGICTPDNLQPHSDAYFSASSLTQIQNYITTRGDGCAVKTPTGNKLVSLPPFGKSYYIPYQTPFELTAPTATDSLADTLVTYCWEEWDLGDFGATLANTHNHGPIFRSYSPVKSETRVFPQLKMVLKGVLSNAGVNDSSGEKAADVARGLNFRLTVRNIRDGKGCFLVPSDSIHLDVINTGSGFKVTSHTDGATFLGKTPQIVTWNVANTTEAPINASTVDIYISGDGGYTWPYFLGTFPNTGSASIVLPNPEVSIPAARIKVKGTGNVFFNVNSKDFAIDRNFEIAVHIYPVPTRSVLHILTENSGTVDAAIFNAVGQRVWKGAITGQEDIPVTQWARGVYIVKLVDSANRPVIRKILIE